jgi:hypothetical protein
MHRPITAPLIITGLFGFAEFLWCIALSAHPDPFSPGSALLIVAGIVAYTAIATVGILLVRASWARWLALGTVVVTLAVGSLGDPYDAVSIAATVLSLIAVGGLVGPWLRIWLRQRPGTGAGPISTALPLAALAGLPLAGIAVPDALSAPALAVAFGGPVLAWAYARALRWGLWGLRVVLPILAIIAGAVAARWGTVWFLAYAAGVAVIAWTPEARDAQIPVQAPLPPPRVAPRSEGEG